MERMILVEVGRCESGGLGPVDFERRRIMGGELSSHLGRQSEMTRIIRPAGRLPLPEARPRTLRETDTYPMPFRNPTQLGQAQPFGAQRVPTLEIHESGPFSNDFIPKHHSKGISI